MDIHTYRTLNRKTFTAPEILLNRLACVFPNQKSNSGVIYDERDEITLGSIIDLEVGQKQRIAQKQRKYCIATGKTIEKDGKKYYEVWADIYNHDQARILATAFRSMGFSKNFKLIEDK